MGRIDGMTETATSTVDAEREEPEKKVTPFELFFDLVFVFALTQVTALLIEDSTAVGVLRGVLVLAMLWWAWGSYAWLTNAIEADRPNARLVILTSMASMLVVAIAVPHASGDDALPFALGYFVVRLLHIVLYAVAGGSLNRAAILRIAPGNLTASTLLVIGVFMPSNVQLGLWIAAVLVDYGWPLITGVGGFRVAAAHFYERHHLFVIIALGESLVAFGVGVLGAEALTGWVVAAIVLSMAAIGGLWWTYFDWEAELTAEVLTEAVDARRAHLARDLFSYLHAPLVLGVVFIAVGLEYVGGHPTDPLEGLYQVSLTGGAALFLFSLGAVRSRRGHRQRIDHIVGALACLGLIPVAGFIPSLATLGALVVVLLGVALTDRAQASADRSVLAASRS
jgi:low temperature requirement protein LtrA